MFLPKDSNFRKYRQIFRHEVRSRDRLDKKKKEFMENPDKNLVRIKKAEEKSKRKAEKRKNA